MRKNISQIRRLQNEKEFGQNLVSKKVFLCEANVTTDSIVQVSDQWKDICELCQDKSFSGFIFHTIEDCVAPDYTEMMKEKLSASYIKKEFASGSQLYSFCYKRKNNHGGYGWYEATVNIIKEHRRGDIHIRLYNLDINEQKLKEQRALEERRLYESMIAKAMLAYEVNITRNCAIKGHECWESEFGIKVNSNYNEMISAFAEKGMYKEDSPGFLAAFNRVNVLDSFHNGKRQIICHYRKTGENGGYFWVCCTLHLYEDPETGDVKGYSYVEDIDKQKRAELELKFKAEHDVMTGIYNKFTTERIINNLLFSDVGKIQKHAFFMIDIDNFKMVNDNFGHFFGDTVIAQISAKICSLFHGDDIVGRIGGDEFCVMMKNVRSRDDAALKAAALCNALYNTYRRGSKSCTVSASVGISMYPEMGSNFTELYKNADRALYSSKSNGRNQFSF